MPGRSDWSGGWDVVRDRLRKKRMAGSAFCRFNKGTKYFLSICYSRRRLGDQVMVWMQWEQEIHDFPLRKHYSTRSFITINSRKNRNVTDFTCFPLMLFWIESTSEYTQTCYLIGITSFSSEVNILIHAGEPQIYTAVTNFRMHPLCFTSALVVCACASICCTPCSGHTVQLKKHLD